MAITDVALVLALSVLSASPACHRLIHKDACDPGHECAVTLFLNGQVHCPSTDVEVVKPLPVLLSQASARCVNFVSADVRLLPSRGPPA